jgi:ABC-type polysaccharide/polyol phosphate export permease
MSINLNTLFLIPALFIIYINSFLYGLVLAILGARFRDIIPVVKSVIQVVFFLTPVMWRPDVLSPSKQFIVYLNPFSAFIEIVRAPMLGALPSVYNMIMALLMTMLGMFVSYQLFFRYRSRIIYWL